MAFKPHSGLIAARANMTFWQWVDEKDTLSTLTVLTDATLLQTTSTGYRDIIKGFNAHLNTENDWLEFQIGYTANADGSGAFTSLTPLMRIENTNQGTGTVSLEHLDPPLIVYDTDGGAWTVRAQTNDDACSVTIGVRGWRESY